MVQPVAHELAARLPYLPQLTSDVVILRIVEKLECTLTAKALQGKGEAQAPGSAALGGGLLCSESVASAAG